MQIPGYWSDTELGEVNGSIWFKKNVEIPSELNGKQGKLLLGRIVDADSVYVNGQFVGTTSYQYPPRRYNIPQGLLKTGQNNITVRVVSNRGRGGFILDKPYKIIIDSTTIDLNGEWKFRLGGVMKPLESQTFIRWKSTGLFNAMLHPLLNHSVKGVVWYQGESNTKNPDEYYELLPSMINDWRKQWGDDELPFIYAQLPNYMKINPFPSESNWAETRDAQKSALSLLNTAMAVTIDLGEWNDVHPLNKKDVGKRLALGAFKTAYGETDIVYSGPIYKSHIIDGDKIVLEFSNIGSGLIAKGVSGLKEFAIAGADKNFVWANARIINDKIR
jgi:sialate O-acetylesterase